MTTRSGAQAIPGWLVVAALMLLVGPWAARSSHVSAQAPANRPPGAHLNRVVERLQAGRPVVGAFHQNTGVAGARALAALDLDFAIIEMEHGPYDLGQLQTTLLGMVDRGDLAKKGSLQFKVAPFVRIPMHGDEDSQFTVKQLLDLGVLGIMFPRIENRDQALRVVKSMRYPQRRGAPDMEPIGMRGNGPATAAWFWGLPTEEYIRRADVWPIDQQGELVTLLQIETLEGVKNIESILQVPGISAIFLGPGDLGNSIGVEPVFPPRPETETHVQTVLKACLAAKVACGYPVVEGANGVRQRLAEGFKVLTVTPTEPSAALKTARELAK